MQKKDSEYISYIENGESAAVYVIRDVVKSINTQGKWIDVLSISGQKNKDGQWDFKKIIIEIFPRTINPVYPKHCTMEQTKYITWKTAHDDISEQRAAGKKGIKYAVKCQLSELLGY